MKHLSLSELEVGQEYILFNNHLKVCNHVRYIGNDQQVNPGMFSQGVRRAIGYFEYSRRDIPEQFAVHQFEVGFGFVEITVQHQKGVLIS